MIKNIFSRVFKKSGLTDFLCEKPKKKTYSTIIAAVSSIFIAVSRPNCAQNFANSSATQYEKVFAATEYARILNEQTPFFADPACQILKFYLPYSYYVRVVKTESESVRVIYMENSSAPMREGYLKFCDYYPCDYIPENPYPALNLLLKADEILFSSASGGDARVVLCAGERAYYYGEIEQNGEIFYYVYSGAHIGFVRKNAFYEHELLLHSYPLPETEEEASDSESPLQSERNDKNGGGVSAIAIAIISVIGVCVIYLLFRPESRALKKAAPTEDD